jgi:hypothetical protein
MRLTKEQNQKLLRERGTWVTEACDTCGQLLGAVRWSRKGEAGEWCSRVCRDGIAAVVPKSNSKGCLECGSRLDDKRADADFCSRTHMMRYRRRDVSRTGQKREINGNTPIGEQGLADLQAGGWTDTLIRPTQALETASRIELLCQTKNSGTLSRDELPRATAKGAE